MFICKVSLVIVRFQLNFNFLDRVSKNTQMSSFIPIRPVGGELSHTDRGKDRRTDMTELMVNLLNFANVTKNAVRTPQKSVNLNYIYNINKLMQFIQIITIDT